MYVVFFFNKLIDFLLRFVAFLFPEVPVLVIIIAVFCVVNCCSCRRRRCAGHAGDVCPRGAVQEHLVRAELLPRRHLQATQVRPSGIIMAKLLKLILLT